MASSGSVVKSAAFGNVTLSWYTVSQNVYAKTSKISYKLTIYRSSNISSSADKDYSVTINGATVAQGVATIGGSGTKTIVEGETTLTHDSNGECTFGLAFSMDIEITWSGKWIGTLTASGTGTLNKISTPTISALSSSSVEIGSALTITLNRDKATYLHKLVYTWGSQLVNVEIASGVGTSYTWTIPNDFINYIPNGTSGTCYLFVTTYDSGGTIGTNTVTFTATVPASIKPTINSVTLTDTGSSTAVGWGVWVQNKSKLHVNVGASGIYGSRIVNYQISALGITSGINDSDIGVVASTGSNTVEITVTDSRGRTATTTRTINVEAYAEPLIEVATIERANSSAQPIDNGTYAKITLKASGSSVATKNTVTAKIYHMRSDLTEWTLARTISVAYDYNDIVMIANMVTSRSYAYKIELTDAFATTLAEMTLRAEGAVIGWLAGGLGVSFGKAAEEAYKADFDWMIHGRKGAQFDDHVNVTGNVNATGALNAKEYQIDGNLMLRLADVISVYRGTNMQLGVSSEYVSMGFSTMLYSLRGLLSISGGGILIPSGVRAVKVSAQVCLGTATAGARYMQVSKNNFTVTLARAQRMFASTNVPETLVVSGAITPVVAGDIILVGIYGNTADWVYGNFNQTYLTVEAYV